jgi:tetratricopeptide (TPR) repeat protein
VVVAGPPVAGKTRTAIELVIRLNPPFVLVWPRGRKEGPSSFPGGVALPVPRAVVLADDLPLRPGGEGSSLPEELTALLSACPGLALIATARRDRIPPDVRGVRVVALQGIGWDERLEQLAREVAREEGRPLAEVRRRFTGHPGSLVAGLDRFRQRYDQLHEEMGRALGVQESARRDRLGEIGRRFLQAARALWDLGVRTLSLERIWAVVEKAGGETVAVADRSEVQRALEELAFLWVERGKRPEVARFYEGMLTEVIPSGDGWWERTVWETLRDRKDAAAFVEIGNAWSEEYRDPVGNLRRAIAAYGEALRFWTPDVAPLAYARAQNNLGLAYWRLSEHEDPVGNLRRAIQAFEEALRFWTPDVAPLNYARAQNNLGLAYRRLSEHEDAVGNLRKAIAAYGEALRFWTPDVAPLDYAETQHNLGLAYRRLSEHEDAVGNLRKAIAAFEEALRFRTPEGTPLFYAETQYEMGLAYRRRAELQTDRAQRCADLRAAVRAFREALRFRTPEAAPRWHEEPRQALEEAEEALRRAGCPGSP